MLDQNLPWWRADRPWGFRFSAFDGGVILAGVVGTVIGGDYWLPLAFLIPFTLGHFLLFCNTFRVGGERSLLWIASFFVAVFGWGIDDTGWLCVTAVALTDAPVTVLLVLHTLRSPHYHGIACTRLNPTGYRTGALHEGAFTIRVLRKVGVPPRVIEKLVGHKLHDGT